MCLAFKLVLRIRYVYPESLILIFIHLGSRIPNPGSRIPDPTTATTEEEEKKFVVQPIFGAINITKMKKLYFWNKRRKFFEPIYNEL
jgi:hypothetical protein